MRGLLNTIFAYTTGMESILRVRTDLLDKTTLRDLVVLVVVTLFCYLLSIRFDFAEAILTMSRDSEHYELDELFVFFLALTASLTWFSLRRWKQLHHVFIEQLSLQRELERSNQSKQNLIVENRRLLRALSEAQESERINLARELHDAFGQHLTAIHANATAIKNRINQDQESAEQKAVSCILSSTNFLHSTTRSLLKSLRPPDLDELGLTIALTSLITQWETAHPEVQCHYTITGSDSYLDMDVSLMYYRAVQECLVNIARHSNATEASITLNLPSSDRDTASRLRLEDNGSVTDNAHYAEMQSDEGLGLIGLRERVIGLGGEFQMLLEPNSGVSIDIKLN